MYPTAVRMYDRVDHALSGTKNRDIMGENGLTS